MELPCKLLRMPTEIAWVSLKTSYVTKTTSCLRAATIYSPRSHTIKVKRDSYSHLLKSNNNNHLVIYLFSTNLPQLTGSLARKSHSWEPLPRSLSLFKQQRPAKDAPQICSSRLKFQKWSYHSWQLETSLPQWEVCANSHSQTHLEQMWSRLVSSVQSHLVSLVLIESVIQYTWRGYTEYWAWIRRTNSTQNGVAE